MSVSLKVPFPSASGLRAWLRQGANGAIFLKTALIGIFVFATNSEGWDRIGYFFDRALWAKLVVFLCIWGIAIFAIFFGAFQPRLPMRLLWAAVITVSTAVTWGYFHASGSQLSIYDVLSLWEARHHAGRAAEFYRPQIILTLIVAAAGMAILSMPPGLPVVARRVRMGHLAWLPILPVILIGAAVVAKGERASYAMPSQFRALSLFAIAAETIVTTDVGERRPVAWTPDAKARTHHIVILMDESIRADYIDLTPGNPHTPHLAKLAGKFTDFGPAASGGICSNSANALVRFGASRRDVAATTRSNPTLFRYAKAAGYRTVYIDAQANSHKDPGKRQNFMTAKEQTDIDRFETIQDVPFDRADYRLLEIVAEELRSAQSVFIYANKNGAHVPYDLSYPASEAVYGPTMR
jgi:glucan phosphoethanolaminetransferase (alkaline phosphatase superfamily)